MTLLYESVFGVSAEVSIRVVEPEIGPWLVTVKVREVLTAKPVEGATVEILGVDVREVGTTDMFGSVTLTVTGGTRRIIVSKSGYWTKTVDKVIAEDTTIGVSLVPIWMIVAGGAGAAAIIIGAALLLKRR